MLRPVLLFLFSFFVCSASYTQSLFQGIDSFWIDKDIKITIDRPADMSKHKNTIIIFYALPNGNNTEQTMGKKLKPGDDWHFDIQHIKAQTKFIRQHLKKKNFIVIYLENTYKSWPLWKEKHTDFKYIIPHLVDSLASLVKGKHVSIYLNGHSGGGSFIFAYLAGINEIPKKIKRISFLDSDYGYDSSYYPKISNWLENVKGSALNVFAYNDSIVIYKGRPLVSAKGGTWYRSHLLLSHLQKDYSFFFSLTDSLNIYKSKDMRIQFYFKKNMDGGIYHTQQVELNGFIHSVLCGTKKDSKHYRYYAGRAYANFIE